MRLFTVAFLLCSFTILPAFGGSRLELFLSARALPKVDPCCIPKHFAPDAYAEVFYSPTTRGQFQHEGTTEYIQDSYDPNWAEMYGFYIEDNYPGSFKVDLWDDDLDDNDYIGYAEVTVQEIMRAPGHMVGRRVIGPKGEGWIYFRGSVDGSNPLVPDTHSNNERD